MSKNIIWVVAAIIIILLAAGGVWMWMGNGNQPILVDNQITPNTVRQRPAPSVSDYQAQIASVKKSYQQKMSELGNSTTERLSKSDEWNALLAETQSKLNETLVPTSDKDKQLERLISLNKYTASVFRKDLNNIDSAQADFEKSL